MNLGELIVFHYDGIKTIVWDPADTDHQVKKAETQFNTLIKKGFSALVIDSDKDGGRPVECFDAQAKMILMFPILSGG